MGRIVRPRIDVEEAEHQSVLGDRDPGAPALWITGEDAPGAVVVLEPGRGAGGPVPLLVATERDPEIHG